MAQQSDDRRNAVPHPILGGLLWMLAMGVIALCFLGVAYVFAAIIREPSPHFLADDQLLSFAILLTVSFAFGFAVCGIRRRGGSGRRL